jgi:hypothetical protein
MSQSITVQDLAAELNVTPRDVAHRVTGLVNELGAGEVIAAARGIRTTELTGDAADIIREQLAEAAR